MSVVFDDKSDHCISFILERMSERTGDDDTPIFIGVNGPQGSGKTTLVSPTGHQRCYVDTD